MGVLKAVTHQLLHHVTGRCLFLSRRGDSWGQKWVNHRHTRCRSPSDASDRSGWTEQFWSPVVFLHKLKVAWMRPGGVSYVHCHHSPFNEVRLETGPLPGLPGSLDTSTLSRWPVSRLKSLIGHMDRWQLRQTEGPVCIIVHCQLCPASFLHPLFSVVPTFVQPNHKIRLLWSLCDSRVRPELRVGQDDLNENRLVGLKLMWLYRQ